jgi:hypothetical protein
MSGFYFYVDFKEETNKSLEKFCLENNIKNFTEFFHCTICDSTVNVNFSIQKPVNDLIFDRWEYWKDSKDNLILVAIIKSNYLNNRFNMLKLLGIQTNYEKYNPHITLSYMVEEKIENLPPLTFPLLLNQEIITKYK